MMCKNIRSALFLTTLAAAFVPGLASAEPLRLANDVTVSGDTYLQFSRRRGEGRQGAWAPDLTFRWDSTAFALDATLDSLYDFRSGDDATNIWTSAIFKLAPGEIAVGAPRPVYEKIVPFGNLSPNVHLQYVVNGVFGSSVSSIAREKNGVEPGLSFHGTFGDLEYGVSYHRLKLEGERMNAISSATAYSVGNTKMYGAFEYVDGKSASLAKVEVGADYRANPLSLGVRAGMNDGTAGNIVENDFRFGDYKYAQLRAGYNFNELFSVNADIGVIDPKADKSASIYSIGARYDLAQFAYTQLSATRSSNSEFRSIDLTIGLRF